MYYEAVAAAVVAAAVFDTALYSPLSLWSYDVQLNVDVAADTAVVGVGVVDGVADADAGYDAVDAAAVVVLALAFAVP